MVRGRDGGALALRGHFQGIEGHLVFFVEDLNLSTSVPSGTGSRLEVGVKTEKRAELLAPIADLERRKEAKADDAERAEAALALLKKGWKT